MLVVLDYDAGNLRSVETALHHLGSNFQVSQDPHTVERADRLILPGVGDARAAMDRLVESGLAEALRSRVAAGVPLLGICLGIQIIFESSQESDAQCLGIIPGETIAFDDRPGRKVPHMGWNTLTLLREHPLFAGVPPEASFYFVHSYHPVPQDSRRILGTSDYEETFVSVVEQDNVVATQFHPEKSGAFGLQILQNFLAWKGDS